MDKNYWDNYYKYHGQDKDICKPSTFATFIQENFFKEKSLKIIELGAGNGRDAIFFSSFHHNVIAIDQSISKIKFEKNFLEKNISSFLNPISTDFVKEDYSKYKKINVFYSRFSLHSISRKDEEILLPKIFYNLEQNGLLCIEVRTTKDPLFGIGKFCGDNTYMNDNHKRRFIDTNKFREKVNKLGFQELYFIEKNDLSIHKNDNPVLMRIVLQK